MNRLNILFAVFVLAFFVRTKEVTPQSKYSGQSIEQILAMPEDSINLGIACLVLAKDAYPNLKIEFFDYCLNYMVERIRYLDQGKTNPMVRIGVMNEYLYRPGRWNDSITFTYNLDDLEADSTNDQFLNGYIASKLGSCVTMSMLHLVLAERLGWPIKPVRSAKHFYCRYIKKGFKENNIEATCGGGYIPTWRYATDAGESKKSIKNGAYEKVLTKKEYLANLLDENVRFFREKKKDLDKAIYYTKLALFYDSTYVSAYWNLGQYYREKAIELDSIRFDKIQEVKKNQVVLDRAISRRSFSQMPINPNPQSSPNMPMHPLMQPNKRYDPSIQNPMLRMSGQYQSDLDLQIPSPYTKPNNPYNQFPVNRDPNIKRQDDKIELMQEITNIDTSYGKQILKLIDISHKLKKIAKDRGIVLKFPKEFFMKQAESIEKFKLTGEY